MKFRLLSAMPAMLAALGCAGGADQAAELAVLQFLISSDGTGHFERVSTYCVADTDDEPVSPLLLAELAPFASHVLNAEACRYSQAESRVVTVGTEEPAVRLYARLPDTDEMDRFGQAKLHGLDLERATLVLAGFYQGDTSTADFVCWVTEDRPPEVLLCDVWRIA